MLYFYFYYKTFSYSFIFLIFLPSWIPYHGIALNAIQKIGVKNGPARKQYNSLKWWPLQIQSIDLRVRPTTQPIIIIIILITTINNESRRWPTSPFANIYGHLCLSVPSLTFFARPIIRTRSSLASVGYRISRQPIHNLVLNGDFL